MLYKEVLACRSLKYQNDCFWYELFLVKTFDLFHLKPAEVEAIEAKTAGEVHIFIFLHNLNSYLIGVCIISRIPSDSCLMRGISCLVLTGKMFSTCVDGAMSTRWNVY